MRTITMNTIDTTVNTIIDNTIIVPTINTITNQPINIINDEQILPTNLDHQNDEQEQSFCKR